MPAPVTSLQQMGPGPLEQLCPPAKSWICSEPEVALSQWLAGVGAGKPSSPALNGDKL